MPTTHERLIAHLKLQDALLTRRALQSLRAYVEQVWPILEPDTPFVPNWHIDLLVEYLEAVTAGDLRHVLITVPPRLNRTGIVGGLFP